VRHAVVRCDQLPGWQEMCLSRLPDLYTAHRVPNAQKPNEKVANVVEEWGISMMCVEHFCGLPLFFLDSMKRSQTLLT
jgi:hypothetical protein